MQKELSRINCGTRGFSLIEVVLSCALFALLLGAFIGAYLSGQESSVLAGNRARATFLAEEGLEAVRNIRDNGGLAVLVNGTYGLSTTSNTWVTSGTSDTQGMFTRQVTISSVDSVRKLVRSEVTWQQNLQRTGSVAVSSYLTAWQCADQATLLQVNTGAAALAGANRNLVGITLQNSAAGCGDLRVDQVVLSWTPITGNRRIENVLFSANSVWSGSGASGTTLDITNTPLIEGAGAVATEYQFSNSMNARTFSITYTMSDGSTKTVSNIAL